MSNLQFPPQDATGITDPVNCTGLTSPVARAVWTIDLEFPESFGVTQQSIEASLTAG